MNRSNLQVQHLAQPEATGSGVITTIEAAEFAPKVLRGDGPIVVEFMSYSCSHCGQIEPLLRQLAASLEGQAQIFRVNVVRDRELAGRYEIAGTPTLLMFLDGQVVGRVEGPDPTLPSLLSAISRPFAA